MFFKLLSIAILITIDQISKRYVQDMFLAQNHEPFDLIPGIIECQYSQNTGVAFSMLADKPLFLTIFNSLVLIVLAIYFFRTSFRSALDRLGFAFILAGGLGNLIDRFLWGYVIDFINPTFIEFAIFNLADSFLNIGVALLLIKLIFYGNKV